MQMDTRNEKLRTLQGRIEKSSNLTSKFQSIFETNHEYLKNSQILADIQTSCTSKAPQEIYMYAAWWSEAV
jgi:hypothetical protein